MPIESVSKTGVESVRWDLSDLYPDIGDPVIDQTLSRLREKAGRFKTAYYGRLARLDAPELSNAIREWEAILSEIYKLGQYAMLRYAVDTRDDRIKAFEMKIREAEARLENELVFFDLELGRLAANHLEELLASPALRPYAYFLRRRIETAKYQLSEPEETLINLKNLTGASAFKNLYEEYTTAWQFEFELDGKRQTLSGEELRALRQHADPDVRQRAMNQFLGQYRENQLVITHAFINVIKDYNIEREKRGYPSPISVQNIQNDLSDQVVATLHEVTTASYPLVQRYYRLKAKLLKRPELTLADIYAPLPQATKKYTWEEAQALVLEAFGGFDPEFRQMAQALFDEQRVDAPVLPGKRGGAFCSSSVPELRPYVMLNYLGRLRDVSTLAHELGHAIHSLLSRGQPLLNFHAILPLAETASVFSEMILTDYILKRETDPLVRQSLLTAKLEEIFATSHRQNLFSRFEQHIHAALSERRMSAKEMCGSYQQELSLMFGQAVKIPEEYAWEWAAIPHMVEMPFYVYAYNFANLLVMSLYQQYKEQGPGFAPKFKQLLSLGSSASPTDIAAVAGADISQPQFWRKSFDLIEALIRELEALVESE